MGQKTIEEWQKAEKEKKEKTAGERPAGAPEEPAEERPFGRGAQAAASRTKTIIKFSADVKNLLISGGLAKGEELAGAPALVDSKLGDGHIVMFSFNPMWRHQTHGSFFLVFNAMLNWKNL
jgi:hypothetical protein